MNAKQLVIEVWADWRGLGGPARMGTLFATPARGKEVFSFEYAGAWLKRPAARALDPALQLYPGPQYPAQAQANFGLFLDSSPDRWGRALMVRREAQVARKEGRKPRALLESDYLLGVHDAHRMGALRFRTEPDGPFVSDDRTRAAPPWTNLRELTAASLALERDDAERDPNYSKWLEMLFAPGSSLGGARPKATVLDDARHPWIAKFPSGRDATDVGGWEWVAQRLAKKAGVEVAEGEGRKFATHQHTFLTRRFDREGEERNHFASAMTLLQHSDGAGADTGASYLELATFIIGNSPRPSEDLEQLWRRIVFSICISNVDDHLRNHGFLLSDGGWVLSPAYDLNPVPDGTGLSLNISETDNALDLDLAAEVAPWFRVKPADARRIVGEVKKAVRTWQAEAKDLGLRSAEAQRMASAFRAADE